ncbi:putative exported protease [Serinibacter arcticus]|uniref:Putative exported protease n=1 Tax=Serinibacter arcticus TaxID=1655435 RepID=A0A4Z1E352_9MICO|nr:putative exported protease [Serinibacter arcticus]
MRTERVLRARARVVVATVATAVLALASCTPPGGPYPREADAGGIEDAPAASGFATLADVEAQPVEWAPCGKYVDCATILVPLDYEDVPGETVRIAMKRLPATGDDEQRQGSVVVNPGGPGESGVDLVDAAGSIFSGDVLDAYDVVGFDPRGVGASTQVRCLEPGEDDPTARLYDLRDERDVERFRVDHTALGELCVERSGPLLDHVDTATTARDLDVVRALLGEERLTYLGYSYGTLLGAVYAETFPDRVGRLVLDSAVDPALGYADLQSEQLAGFEQVFATFVGQCQDVAACPLPADADAAQERVLELVDALDADPLPSDAQDGELDGGELWSAVTGAMYWAADWPALVTGLADVEAGTDGTVVDEIGDAGVMAGSDDVNHPFAFPAIDCTDYPMTSTYEQAVENVRALEDASALFGPGSVAELACVLWPAAADVERVPITASGAAPILVVSALRDPATPHAWSVSLADQLESGRLLTYDGEGHAVYGGVSPCVDRVVDTYLLTGELPAEGTICD